MRQFLTTADVLVAHNLVRFDIPVFERILGIKIKARLVDTLALSWILFSDRNKHGLESWGETFNLKKPEINDWHNLSQEEYEHRCKEDVRINQRLWLLCLHKLRFLYQDDKKMWEYLEYIQFKMTMAMLQEKSGWKVDVNYCSQALAELMADRDARLNTLTRLMPKVPVLEKRSAPKKAYKQDGSLSKIGQAWFDLLKRQGLPDDTQETEITVGYEDGNPKSTPQLKAWLDSLGWKPQTFKYVKNKKTGEIKEIPQINLENGKGLCPSVMKLQEKEPLIKELNGLSILNHRIPILASMLSDRDENDFVQAKMNGLTNTLRYQHAMPCVNLPRSDRLYAKAIRGSLVAQEGFILCGADMSSLEDRLKQHFIFPHDPDYVRAMQRDDFDPHIELAMMAGKLTKDDKEFYQWYEALGDGPNGKGTLTDDEKKRYKDIKAIRSIFKNGNYACQYGAFPKRLAITCGISLKEAKEVFDAYWELNKAIKTASNEQTIRFVGEEMFLRNPINGFYYSLREKKDVFSTLVQGSASYVFDRWVQHVLEERRQLTASFHDEIVICIRSGNEDKASDLLNRAIAKTNEELRLNRELSIGIQFGQRYSSIH